jgi:protease-4
MSLDADVIVDRRRLRRKLTIWRVIAFVAVAASLVVVIGKMSGFDPFNNKSTKHIARISIRGVITENRQQLALIERVSNARAVRGVIVSINSPGGTTAGGEALYEALRKLAQAKPTVSHVGTLGTSAGYMAALASDHIVARRSAITGSIGVIFQYVNVSGLLKTVGVRVDEIKSSPLKAEPTPFKPLSEEGREVLRAMVLDTYNWFVDLVADRRKFDRPEALRLSDGRVYTGHQAHAAKLVDEIGGEEVAVAWLENSRGVAKGLKIRDWNVRRDIAGFDFLGSALAWMSRQVGIDLFGRSPGIRSLVSQRLDLDGLLSVWHASSERLGR